MSVGNALQCESYLWGKFTTMKLSEYKRLGILDAYALGVLDPERTEQLESDLETNVALRRELNEVEGRLENFKKNFTRSDQKKKHTGSPTKKTSPAKSSKNRRIVTGLLILLVVGLTFVFLSTLYQKATVQGELNDTNLRLSQISEENDDLMMDRKTLESGLWNAVENSDAVVSLRAGDVFSQRPTGHVVKCHLTERYILLVENLNPPDEGQFYQMWGQSGTSWRRMGLIQKNDMGQDGRRQAFIFPQPATDLELITLESTQPPESPDRGAVVFQR